MELKVAKKKSVDAIRVVVLSGDESIVTIELTAENVRERLVEMVLFEIQRVNSELVFTTSGSPPYDYISELETLEKVSTDQESAVEELRTKNEEQETRIELLERQLGEAHEACEDWAKKFKKMKLVEDAEAIEEKPS